MQDSEKDTQKTEVDNLEYSDEDGLAILDRLVVGTEELDEDLVLVCLARGGDALLEEPSSSSGSPPPTRPLNMLPVPLLP